jgi:hypothetical protein
MSAIYSQEGDVIATFFLVKHMFHGFMYGRDIGMKE